MDQLPCNIPAEESIISSILLGGSCSDKCLGIAIERLETSDFYSIQAATVFEAAKGLFSRGIPVDIITASDALRESGNLEKVGGLLGLGRFLEEIPAAQNFPHYCDVVKRLSDKRRFWAEAHKIAALCVEVDSDPVEIKEAVDAAFVLSREHVDSKTFNAGDLSHEVLKQAGDPAKANRGLFTPWANFNYLTKGLQPQNLVILAARPGFGKSALAINLTEALVAAGKPVAFFSLEMSGPEIIRRIMSARTGLSASRILDGGLHLADLEALGDVTAFLQNAPLYIEDQGGLSVPLIRAKAKRIKAQHGLSLIVVDYLQLVRGPKAERRDLVLSQISAGLKELAKELDIPVLALAQLNRANEKENRRPRLSDLRESGSLEQDADLVAFLHRENDNGDQAKPTDLILAKHRNGKTGLVKMLFHGKTTTFEEAKP